MTRISSSRARGRDLAAYRVLRRTTATLRGVASFLELGHPDSASNLIRRAESVLALSSTLRLDLENIDGLHTDTE